MNDQPRLVASSPVLAVHDLDRAARWFANVLDCQVTEVEPGNWVFCRSGDVTFMLGRCPDVAPASDIGDHSYVAYLRVSGIDEFHQRALAARAEVRSAPSDKPWGMREKALRSPDGHRFMLGEPV